MAVVTEERTGLRVRLLGRPCAELDGRALPGPRGRKSWALLAVLLLAERPPTRRTLSALLFGEADDPLGALRWTLSQLRAALGTGFTLAGDPVRVTCAPDCRVDLLDVLAPHPGTDAHPGTAWLGGQLHEPLLDGADGIAGPDFDLWLTTTRHRVDSACAGLLRHSARALAPTHPAAALTAATRAAMTTALVAPDDHATALTELGALGATLGGGGSRHLGAVEVVCRIEAGQAAIVAGAAGTGLGQLREAARLAGRGDERLRATALCALGGGLVHAVAAHAEEGARALREAARLARRTGDRATAAEALRDLAYVETAAGRVAPARRLLHEAAGAAEGDPNVLSAVHGVAGMDLADRGAHTRALRALRRSAEAAEDAGRVRQASWSRSLIARSLLLRGELDAAAAQTQLALEMATEQRWMAFLPWLEVVLAEVDLGYGRVGEAERRARHAWSLSLVVDDWCWQGLAARGLGLVHLRRGALPEAITWLDEAARRARRDHDRYVWIHAWVQDALCDATVRAGLPRAAADVAELARIAAQAHMPEFAFAAELHRAALGDRDAGARAGAIAQRVDNPALAAHVRAHARRTTS